MDECEQAADRLIRMGYLKYVPKNEISELRAQMIETLRRGYLETDWDSDCISGDRRSYPADSEELTEGRTGEFILLMQGVLRAEGVVLDSVEDDFGDKRYDVVIDGRRYPVWDSTIPTMATWAIATKRFLETVNDLLQQAGSAERVYGIYGGNDARCILLTDEMYSFLEGSGLKIDPDWMPYPPSAIRDDGCFAR